MVIVSLASSKINFSNWNMMKQKIWESSHLQKATCKMPVSLRLSFQILRNSRLARFLMTSNIPQAGETQTWTWHCNLNSRLQVPLQVINKITPIDSHQINLNRSVYGYLDNEKNILFIAFFLIFHAYLWIYTGLRYANC